MKHDIGKQYSRDIITDRSGFLKKARLHQSTFRANVIDVSYDKYGNYLLEEDAKSGLNFYNDFEIFEEVKKRYPNYSKPLYANMLRSEHIGFNLFIPFKHDLVFGAKVFNELLNGQIQEIERIEIEYAPSPSDRYLNDKTSFDAYIEYKHVDGGKGIIGIEVKYTEHGYALMPGSKQERDIKNKNSKYYLVSERCGLYKPGSVELLITDNFRQVWRNQLLGESILIEDADDFKYFTSMTIFPEGNVHFSDISEQYINMLVRNDNHFLPVTYEHFLDVCQEHSNSSRIINWLDYLNRRYIVQK